MKHRFPSGIGGGPEKLFRLEQCEAEGLRWGEGFCCVCYMSVFLKL